RRTAEVLAASHWDVIVASPLARAAETAAIIADRVGMDVSEHLDGLLERGYGEAEGLTASQARQRWPDGDYPGMDSEAHVGDRGMTAINTLHEQFPDGRVLAVTHGTLIRLVMSEVLGYAADHIRNATVSEVRYSHGWRALTINSVPITAEHTGAMPAR